MIRTYVEMSRFETFDDRFNYLKLKGHIGESTFGFDRYINQKFYRSNEWRSIRQHVILRDNGCDLGIEGFEIHRDLFIHHMNPMTVDDVLDKNYDILNPNYLVCVSRNTHNAIHYGSDNLLPKTVLSREPGDTKLW